MERYANLRVLILAGGMGTRLSAKLNGKPKILAPIGNRTFLDWMLIWLESSLSPVKYKVSLCTGHLSAQVQKYCKDTYPLIRISAEEKPLGTMGAIVNALPFVSEEYLLVLNGDTLFDANLARVFSRFLQQPDAPLLVVRNQVDTSRYQAYALDSVSKALTLSSTGNYVSMGAFFATKSILLQRKSSIKLPAAVDTSLLARTPLKPYVLTPTSFFIDIGVPQCYERAQSLIPNFIKKMQPLESGL
jgi:D-glycero-alpha-D-manno-heptose 1-phosphate guanylyltransferase